MTDTSTREEFIAAVQAQAFDTGRECPTCHGDGVVRPGRRIVHCQGSFTGADWDEAGVIDTIRSAKDVAWSKTPHLGDHNLHVLDAEGKVWRFQVSNPALAGQPYTTGSQS